MSQGLQTLLLAGGLFIRRHYRAGRRHDLPAARPPVARCRRDAEGTIIDLRREAAGDGVGWFPAVEFDAHDGTRYAFTSEIGVMPLFRRKGQRVRVIYDPAMLMGAMIRSRLWMGIAPAVSIYVSIAMITRRRRGLYRRAARACRLTRISNDPGD